MLLVCYCVFVLILMCLIFCDGGCINVDGENISYLSVSTILFIVCVEKKVVKSSVEQVYLQKDAHHHCYEQASIKSKIIIIKYMSLIRNQMQTKVEINRERL